MPAAESEHANAFGRDSRRSRRHGLRITRTQHEGSPRPDRSPRSGGGAPKPATSSCSARRRAKPAPRDCHGDSPPPTNPDTASPSPANGWIMPLARETIGVDLEAECARSPVYGMIVIGPMRPRTMPEVGRCEPEGTIGRGAVIAGAVGDGVGISSEAFEEGERIVAMAVSAWQR